MTNDRLGGRDYVHFGLPWGCLKEIVTPLEASIGRNLPCINKIELEQTNINFKYK